MGQRQVEVSIWSASDDARAAKIVLVLQSAGLRVRSDVSASESPDIVLVLPGKDTEHLAARCDEAHATFPEATSVVLMGEDPAHAQIATERHAFERLPVSTDVASLPEHLLAILARWKRIEKLKSSAATLQQLESTIDLIYFDFRPETGTFLPSERLRDLLGLDDPDDAMTPTPLLERIHSEDRALFAGTLFEAARTGTPFCLAVRITDADGQLRHFRTRGRAFAPHGTSGSPRVFAVCEDMTDHMERIASAEARSQIDDLTGLGNRRYFDSCLSHAIEVADAETATMALLYLDLDRFKLINDTLGHDAGDQLLRIVSARLQDVVRAHDLVCKANEEPTPGAQVSRLGGDEFTVLLTDIHGPADAEIVASRLLIAISEPIDIQGKQLSPSASIGIACFPHDGRTTDDLRRRADAALYSAKESGGGFRFFKQRMEDRAVRRISLESELRQTIESGQIGLVFQPRVRADSGEIIGAEAVIDWSSPTLGPVPSEEVARIADEAGLAKMLGRLTIGAACQAAVSWPHGRSGPRRVSIDASPAAFEHGDLFDMVIDALKESELPPNRLDLEIGEDLLLRPNPAIGEALEELRRIGVSILLDEFGRGYSALRVLMNQPLDGLKLDRRLVETVSASGEGSQLLSNVIRMALDLSLLPIGIGVADETQAKFLVQHGALEMQGPFFGADLGSRDFCERLASGA